MSETLHEQYLRADEACTAQRAAIDAAYDELAALVKERDRLGQAMTGLEARELRALKRVAGAGPWTR